MWQASVNDVKRLVDKLREQKRTVLLTRMLCAGLSGSFPAPSDQTLPNCSVRALMCSHLISHHSETQRGDLPKVKHFFVKNRQVV